MFSIQCPHCGAKLNVPEAALGKNGRCPKCQQKFLVQVPAPLDELVPLVTSPAPLDEGDFYSLQPLPPAAMPLGAPMALPSQTAARPVAKGQNKQKAESAGLGNWQKITLLVGGGILLSLALFVVVGGLVHPQDLASALWVGDQRIR